MIYLFFNSIESKCFDNFNNIYPGLTNIATKIYERAAEKRASWNREKTKDLPWFYQISKHQKEELNINNYFDLMGDDDDYDENYFKPLLLNKSYFKSLCKHYESKVDEDNKLSVKENIS